MKDLQEILEPLPLKSFSGTFFDSERIVKPAHATCRIEDECIVDFSETEASEFEIPENVLVLPGGISLHVHGRDAYEVYPNMEGDQSYKEDSYSLSLALAQGGATYAMCMLNFPKIVETQEQYNAQLKWMNEEQKNRKKPIMRLGAYVPIRPGSRPLVKGAWYKLFWNTFGGANFASDDEVRDTLRNYSHCRVKAHAETIKDMIRCPALPHHLQRPKEAAINATQMFLDCAREFNFSPDLAHIGTAEEIRMIRHYNASRGMLPAATYEVTPQSLMLDYSAFEKETGLPIIFGQQNPPLRSFRERREFLQEVGDDAVYASDHAPHTIQEKLKGISGMPQASTEGQVYLEHMSLGHCSLAGFIRRRSLNPGKLLEQQFGLTMGRITQGYDASFTLVSLGKPSRICDKDVLSKCSWTPYCNWVLSNTIEGVIIRGVLYTQKALQLLRQ